MDLYLLHLVLLGFWLPLLWPVLRTKGGLRLWLLLVIALGLVASLREARLWFGTPEAIRVDILYGAPILAGVYAVTAVLLFRARWRRFALVFGSALLLLWAGAAFLWRELEREQERFVEGRALIARAGFRSPETYDKRFGPFAPAVAGLPVGHWVSGGEPLATRLIINGEGRVWLFRGLSGAETLDFASASQLLRRQGEDGATWTGDLKGHGVSAVPALVEITWQDDGRLTLAFRGWSRDFTKTPPPIEAAPERHDLSYLGSFGDIECDGRRLDLAQVWLWRDEERLYAAGVVRTFSQSQQASFATPMVLGSAQERGGAWNFAWDGMRGPSQAKIVLGEGQVVMTIKQGTWPEQRFEMMRDKGFLAGDMVDLAPLTTAEAWQHWFSVVPLGNRVTGQNPACE